jgi:hypothetical protein
MPIPGRRGARDPPEHPLENQLMNGRPEIPVHQADISGRVEYGRLTNPRPACGITVDLELQPKAPGDLHLRGQTKTPGRLELLDAPKVDCVAHSEIEWVAPSAAQSNPAAKRVEHAA